MGERARRGSCGKKAEETARLPNRRATALPNGRNQTEFMPKVKRRAMKERIGDEGPDIGADAAGR